MEQADRSGTFEVLKSLNEALGETKLTPARLEQAFERWWPELAPQLSSIPGSDGEGLSERPQSEILSEILENTREVLRREESQASRVFGTGVSGQLGSPPIRYVVSAEQSGGFRWSMVDSGGGTIAVFEEEFATLEEALAAVRGVHSELQRVEILEVDNA